jgi:hypothetical protein
MDKDMDLALYHDLYRSLSIRISAREHRVLTTPPPFFQAQRRQEEL